MCLTRGILHNNTMKYFISIYIFFISLFVPLHVHAGAAGGGSTEITQILNNVQLVPINISSAVSAVATNGTFINDTILGPIANALISNALKSVSNDILSWVSGGFGGSDPLIIADPESFIKNKGLDAIKASLTGIPTDSAFGDSIFNSILNQYKGSNDLNTTLANLSKSASPSRLQDKLCTQTMLTSLALEAVRKADGSYDAQELATEEANIWSYACVGDAATDQQVAKRVKDIGQQKPSVDGWDGLFAVIDDSEFRRTELAKEVAAEKKEAEEDITSKEIFDGAGPVSERECTSFSSIVNIGQDPTCLNWITSTPGEQVASTLSEALTAGTKRLENIMGAGSLTGMLQGLAISAITSGIKKALNNSGSGVKYNIATTLPSSRPVEQDLVDDPRGKSEGLKPMNKQLTYYLKSLNELTTFNTNYLSDMNSYEAKVQAISNCTQASSFYNERIARINTIKASITGEQAKIDAAKALISDTKTRLEETNSSQEQGTIFNAYMEAVEDNGYPDSQTVGERRSEYQKNKFEVDNDTDLSNFTTTCNQSNNINGAP